MSTLGIDVIGAWEWIVILIVVVVIILWGPSKIPELARAVGRAKGEFERASKGYSTGALKTETETKMSDDDMIIVIARGMGINTEGKSKEQIFQEITNAIKASKTSS
ncbi:MAG: twin-arginine translocase TatA/TatE family subunit [Candidatus Bathycorpusculaceae bacterium]